jgi:hypothetical protein
MSTLTSNERLRDAEHLLRRARERLTSNEPSIQYFLHCIDNWLSGCSSPETPEQHTVPCPTCGHPHAANRLGHRCPDGCGAWIIFGDSICPVTKQMHIARDTQKAADGQSINKNYPICGSVEFRESTNEWVLELRGTIEGCDFVSRHTEPSQTRPQDVPGLPSLYVSTEIDRPDVYLCGSVSAT